VTCLKDVCGFNGALVSVGSDADGSPNPLDPNPQQFWRFFTATYLHLGIIHIIIILPIQLYVGIKIERTIGWLRTGIVYTLSGVGGNLVRLVTANSLPAFLFYTYR
jgi:membrane associated rhomboid family serine protease